MAAKKNKARHPRRAYTFTVLDGPTYDERDRPPSWTNRDPLAPPGYTPVSPPDMERLPLDAFPLIEDVEVRLVDRRDAGGRSRFGYHVRFVSPTLGDLGGFPWWDHAERDLARDDAAIPLGPFERPFSDVEQGWEIVIAARGALMYILGGAFDQRKVDGYHQWFSVRKARYIAQWERAIAASQRLRETAR